MQAHILWSSTLKYRPGGCRFYWVKLVCTTSKTNWNVFDAQSQEDKTHPHPTTTHTHRTMLINSVLILDSCPSPSDLSAIWSVRPDVGGLGLEAVWHPTRYTLWGRHDVSWRNIMYRNNNTTGWHHTLNHLIAVSPISICFSRQFSHMTLCTNPLMIKLGNSYIFYYMVWQ